ncbi:MAG: glycosyltransferase family 61 protein [Pseudomonadota bacterium]|nr:glycosyltransferase family 61 protein [Pseudomonadota bacterium]
MTHPIVELIGPLSEVSRQRLEELCAQSPVPEGRVARNLQIVGVDDVGFAQNIVLNPADLGLPDSLKSGFVEFRDAIVTPLGFVVAGDYLIFNTQILPNGWMRGGAGGAPELIRRIFERNFIHRLDVWRDTCLLSTPGAMEEIAEPAFLFNSRLSWCNFAHFVHDTLIQTPTFANCAAHVGQSLQPVMVGPGFHYPIMPEVFAGAIGAAGKPPLFTRGRFFRVKRLFVPNTHFAPARHAIARGAVDRLMRRLARAWPDHRGEKRRRVFISREDSSRGADREPTFGNTAALKSALGEIGVEPLVVSRLDPAAYLDAFVNAELIVGLHGAGLMNVVLSPSPRVLEITVPGYPDWNSLNLFIEKGMGAPFRRVVMPAPRDGVADYDIPALVAACKELMATPIPRA